MARDDDKNDNKSRGSRRPPGRGCGERSGGRSGGRSGERSGGGRSGSREERGEKRSFGAKRSFGDRDRSSGDRPSRGKSFGDKPGGFRKGREDGPRRERSEGGFRKEGGFKREFKPRDREGGEGRGFKKDFKPRGDRDFNRDDKPRGERPPRRDFSERPARRDNDSRSSERPRSAWSDHPRSDAPRGDRREGGFKRDFKPRGEGREGGFRKDFKPRDRGGDRSREDRPPRRDFDRDKPRREFGSDRPRGEFRSERPRRDDRDAGFKKDFKPRGERSFSRDEASRGDRPRGDRPPRRDFGDRPPRRDGDVRSERPRFNRDRDDKPRFSRDRDDRAAPREGYKSREDRPRAEDRTPEASKTGERIAKVVARAGLASRREAETWITEGRVAVNGRVITSPALDVVASDKITIDGKPLPPREKTRLFLYHKPRGLVTTHSDPEGRTTVFESLPEDLPRVISVGRLDYNTEGLLLLTNDGALARALELPANGWLRRYRVRAHGSIEQEQLDALKDGIEIDGVRYGSIVATLDRDKGANVWITVEIREGKNREVRNVLAHLGLDVNRLIRVAYGPFQLGELAEGAVEEVGAGALRAELGAKIAGLLEQTFDETKPKQRKAGLIADRKGRRVLVERNAEMPGGGEDGDGDDFSPPRAPKRRYHGKRGA